MAFSPEKKDPAIIKAISEVKTDVTKSMTADEKQAEKDTLTEKEAIDKKTANIEKEKILSELHSDLDEAEKQETNKEKPRRSTKKKRGKTKTENSGSTEKIKIPLWKSIKDKALKLKELIKKNILKPLSFIFWTILLVAVWIGEQLDKKGKK